jgi:uncharacterized membrane protein
MGTVAHYLEVNVPADQCYAWWRGLTNLPQILPDVESVTTQAGDGQLTHWKVSGPLGKTVEWDAKGATTGIEVSLAYDPPAGIVGDAVAKLFADPQDKVERALESFKATIEAAGTTARS